MHRLVLVDEDIVTEQLVFSLHTRSKMCLHALIEAYTYSRGKGDGSTLFRKKVRNSQICMLNQDYGNALANATCSPVVYAERNAADRQACGRHFRAVVAECL